MGRRTGDTPQAGQDMKTRLSHALDMTPRELARTFHVPLPALDNADLGHPIWEKIKIGLDEKLAMLLAVKQDLDDKRQRYAGQRATRLVKSWTRAPKSSPRS